MKGLALFKNFSGNYFGMIYKLFCIPKHKKICLDTASDKNKFKMSDGVLSV